jgi:hypothetical protein
MVRAESYGDIPQFKSILFGCDNWATVLDEFGPYKDNEGVWMKKFLITPSEHLIKNYPWLMEEGRLTDTKHYGPAIWVEYPYEWVNDKSTSKTNAIVRVYCSFDGGETSETERHKYYTERLKDIQKENNHLKESIAYYIDMLGNALKMDKSLALRLSELMGILSKGGKSSEEEEGEQQPSA